MEGSHSTDASPPIITMQRRSSNRHYTGTTSTGSTPASSPQSDYGGGSGGDYEPCLLDPYYVDDRHVLVAPTLTRSNDSSSPLASSSSSSSPLATHTVERHRGRRRKSDDPTMRRGHQRSQSPSSSSSSTSSSGLPLAKGMAVDPESLVLAQVRRNRSRKSVQTRRRVHSLLARHHGAVPMFFGTERAVRTLMMALLVASLVMVMFLAFLVPSPGAIIDEESRIMWNLGGGETTINRSSDGTALQGRDSVCVLLKSTALLSSPRASVVVAAPPVNESISSGTDDGSTGDDDRREPDFGGLEIEFFEEPGVSRAIYHDPSLDETKKDRKPQKEERVDVYYAFDDDERRNPYLKRKGKEGQRCRRTHFHRRLPINCNAMYEMDFWNIVALGNQEYLGGGSYRDVHLIDIEGDGKYVYKTSGPNAHFRYDDYEFIRMDCVVLELLSSRPSIVNSYAYCGLDQIGEAMLSGDFETIAWPIGGRKKITLRDAHDVDPQNNLSPDDKLRYALEMAEALAELHGFHGGVLVHDDVQLSQFLLTEDGHLRLNDFNRAEFMLWNEEHGEYCKYQNNPGHGDWRAPEEYFDDPLDEKIDVFSLGNNLYATLTGLSPFYDTLKPKDAVERVKRGDKPYIDPRWRNHSFAEGKIVDLIEKCQPFKAEDRIDIFEAVRFLRDAVQENERREKEKKK